MKKIKQLLSALLAAMLLLSGVSTAFAAEADTGFSDVAADAWYAEAVEYVRDNGLMSGTGPATFSPDAHASRAMLTTILYRASGSSAVSKTPDFSDVSSDAYYADAVAWATENDIVSGYGNGLFGSDDPVSREQIATILWRYAGRPAADPGENFADESSISSYAADAVDWARANGIVNGKEDNRFDPQWNATRAEVAIILRNYMTKQNGEHNPESNSHKTLVVYYSATGSTEAVAETVATALNADLFEITPADAYTSDDLNWSNASSRVSLEHDNPSLRTVALTSTTVENWNSYDTVLIGYPIWWGIAAWPVDSFIRVNDFTGKTVIPFCTSSSSGMGESGKLLAELAGTGSWQDGQRFSSEAAKETVQTWADSLALGTRSDENAETNQASKSLVVYFSMPETTNPNNMTTEEDNSTVVIDGTVIGNTQYMAGVIQKTVGADIFRIEPVTPYPTEHRTLVDLAAEEQDRNARPAIRGQIDNFEQYNTIFIGYPIWWSDMPQILYTFFDSYDFNGKTIVPFSTHGGSGFAGTPNTIRELEPNATMLEGLTISRDRIQEAEQQIVDWANGFGI